MLLRKEANSPSLTGELVLVLPDGRRTSCYNYEVVRLWEWKPERILEGGLAVLPLAPLSDVGEAELPGLVNRMAARINNEPPARASLLWTATFLFMGLKFPREYIGDLPKGVSNMQESTTYQGLLEDGRKEGRMEGRVEEARRLLLRLGGKRFHEPDEAIAAEIDKIQDLARLEDLHERLLLEDVKTWSDLLRKS